jgi:predicted type IV restriction endonuclease
MLRIRRRCAPEFSTQAGKPDYALLGDDGKPLAFLGAKSLGKQEDLNQYISYCVSEGVGYFITSDGVQWEVTKPLHLNRFTRSWLHDGT